MEEPEELLGMTAETAGHDLLAACVDEMKAMPDVWQKLTNDQQDDVIERLRKRVETVTRQAVEAIASEGRITVVARIDSVAIKDGVTATLKVDPINTPSSRQTLFQSVRQSCLIVLADPGEYLHGMGDVQGDKDQQGLPGVVEPDPLFDEALRFVVESRRPTISFVQRKFKIGYNRAARLIEAMEVAGRVTPMGANGVREVIG